MRCAAQQLACAAMKLTTRVLLLLVSVLTLALGGSLLLHTWAARQALQEQLELRNRDAAASLALALSQQQGEATALQTVAAAHFDTGGYSLVRLQRNDGVAGISLQRADPVSVAPAWFVAALPMTVEPGRAVVTHGWKELGSLQVAAHSAWAHAALWDACRYTAAWLSLLGLLTGLLAVAALRAWQRPLSTTVSQARALENGRFLEAAEPGLPELKTLTRTMNSMVRRLRKVLSQQATQLAELQQEALHDAVTGLLQRRHFLTRLAALRAPSPHEAANRLLAAVAPGESLTTPEAATATTAATAAAATSGSALASAPAAAGAIASGPGLALLLLRVQDLEALNLRLGRASADRLLATIAHSLEPYVERVEGSFAGRLNGADFALCLPVAGVAEESARSLYEALMAAPALTSAGAVVAVGGVDVLPAVGSSDALSLADAALAHAEAGRGWFAVAPGAAAGHSASNGGPDGADSASSDVRSGPESAPQAAWSTLGSQVWRSQIAQALAENRVELAQFVVLNRQHQVLHLECPLRVQLQQGQPYQSAVRWLALARRSRLMPQVDLKALEWALAAIEGDRQARSVHVSWPSLAAPGFAAEVSRRLRRAPTAARRLSIEWGQSARPHDWISLAMATQGWRDLGVKVGAKHALAQPQQLVALQDLGIDYVKVDPQHLLGAASDEGIRTYVQALVRLIHGLGAQAHAGGVTDEQDLLALWACGFDAATGPAVTAAWAARGAAPVPGPEARRVPLAGA